MADPMQWIGAGAILIAGILALLLLSKIYRPDFLGAKSRLRLCFALAFLSVGLACIFLAIERFSLMAQNTDIGIVFAYIALNWSLIGTLGYYLFAVYACFPTQIKKLGILAIILNSISILNGLSTFNGLQVEADYEIAFPLTFNVIFLVVTGSITFITTSIWAYYSYSMKSKSQPHSQRALWLAISGLILVGFYLPEIMSAEEIVNYTRILVILAIGLQYLCFTRFVELDWPTKVRHLYLIHREKSIALYNYSFVKEELADTNLVAGGISGTAMLIQELMHSKHQLKVIDLEKLKVMLEYGEHVLAALVTEENFKILRTKLGEFIQNFERLYKEPVLNFAGEIKPFETADQLVDQVFHYKKIF